MEFLHKEQLNQDLLIWYRENARILPWRSEPTPYRVWVSEIMLQQTRVEAVKPYFSRFMKAIPDISALAMMEDDALHKLWEGLGYYNRVRNMKRCAQECVEKYQGKLPESYDDLLALPGIGEYTAGAIASIAFKQKVPAVDGNVLRVFSRLMVCDDDILKAKTKTKFQAIISRMMSEDYPDEFNQAIMEIGATICVPNAAPRCNICPLAKHCLGYQQGKAHFLPVKKAKAKRKRIDKTILVVIKDGKIGIRQRPDIGLLASLYEFISIDEKMKQKAIVEYLNNIGCTHRKLIKIGSSKHIFTHLEWHMQGYLVICEDTFVEDSLNYVTSHELQTQYAIPTALKVYRDGALSWLKNKEIL